MNKEKLSGVFAPVVTPFDNDEVRYDWLEENLGKLGKSKLKGYLALGTNGEFKSLSREEQIQVVKVFAAHKGDKTLTVGTAKESTRETIEFSREVAEIGADFVTILTPHYFAKRMNDEVLIRYYREIADAVPRPVLIYTAPAYAGGVQISARAINEVAKHPNIAGLKDTSPAGFGSYLAATRENSSFHILPGSANIFFPALILGAIGGVLSLTNFLPDLCCQLYQDFTEGKMEEAQRLHFKIFALNQVVSIAAGVAGVKAAMELKGYRGGLPRRPLLPLGKEGRKLIEDTFREHNVL